VCCIADIATLDVIHHFRGRNFGALIIARPVRGIGATYIMLSTSRRKPLGNASGMSSPLSIFHLADVARRHAD
jgi:hypothetical protein